MKEVEERQTDSQWKDTEFQKDNKKRKKSGPGESDLPNPSFWAFVCLLCVPVEGSSSPIWIECCLLEVSVSWRISSRVPLEGSGWVTPPMGAGAITATTMATTA